MRDAPASLPGKLAGFAKNLLVDKWDELLPETLLRMNYGCQQFDIAGCIEVCEDILAAEP
jgi:hypothetical protein